MFSSGIGEETPKFGGSVMIRRCISQFGVDGMDCNISRLESEQFLSILNSHLLLTLDRVASQKGSFAKIDLIFHQDIDHTFLQ